MLSRKLISASGQKDPLFISSSVNQGQAASSITVSAPTGIQDGDFLVAIGFSQLSGVHLTAIPTGFIVETGQAAGEAFVFVATKTASSESGSYTFTFSSAASCAVAILVYRNASKVNTVGTVSSNTTTNPKTATSITPTKSGTLVAAYFLPTRDIGGVTSPPPDMTLRASNGNNNAQVFIYDQEKQPASATGDKSLSMGTAGSGVWMLLCQVTNEPDLPEKFVASAQTQGGVNASNIVINKPTGTVEGDLMVAMVCGNSNESWTGDTGWTEVADNGEEPSVRVAYKVAGASEPSSYTFTPGTTTAPSGCILTYRGVSYGGIGSFTTSAHPLPLPSVTPSESQSRLIALGARNATSVTLGTPLGMTARVTDNDATAPSFVVCEQVSPKGPSGIRRMSTRGTLYVHGLMLFLTPS